MDIDLKQLETLISHQSYKIEKAVSGTGYLPKTVIGVGTFLLDNLGDYELLTAKQQVTFMRFLQPLLEENTDG